MNPWVAAAGSAALSAVMTFAVLFNIVMGCEGSCERATTRWVLVIGAVVIASAAAARWGWRHATRRARGPSGTA